MEHEKFSLRARINSFGYAFKGLQYLVKHEHNVIIHFVATIIVIAVGVWLKLQNWEWAIIALAAGFVWVTETLNTCIEKIMDFISTEQHPKIADIKDLASGAVLIAAIAAVIAGGFIFIPKIIALL